MEMPTLQEIFYNMNGEEITSPELEDLENSFKRVLKRMIERKKIEPSAANRIAEFEPDITQAAKCAGFVQGFAFAVGLFLKN